MLAIQRLAEDVLREFFRTTVGFVPNVAIRRSGSARAVLTFELERGDPRAVSGQAEPHGKTVCGEPSAELPYASLQLTLWDGNAGNGWADDCLDQRWILWPQGMPAGPYVGVLSSRVGRRLELQRSWLAEVQTVAREVAQLGQTMLLVPGTAAAMYAQRAAELCDAQRIVLLRDGEFSQSGRAWLKAVRRRIQTDEGLSPNAGWAWVSPPIARWADGIPGGVDVGCQRDETRCGVVRGVPVQDRLLASLSERRIVLSAKRGGNTERLVEGMLQWERDAARTVYLTSDVSRIPKALRERWVAQGAILLEPCQERESCVVKYHGRRSKQRPWRNVAELPGCYLTHCTRARFGPWPGQAESEYLDDLLLNRPAGDHRPLGALRRIIEQRRLMAASGVVRCDAQVVCFSAVPPGELSQIRTFRPHRARWDFEPYGIIVTMAALVSRGARPVIYGDESVRKALPVELLPFFQVRSTHTGRGNVWDWSVEHEWRHEGDVDLSNFDESDVFVMVKCADDALQVADVCPWEVCLVEQETATKSGCDAARLMSRRLVVPDVST